MRKNLLNALVIGSLMTAGASQAEPLMFDPDGTGSLGALAISAFDWGPTSFLAKNGNLAIANYLSGGTGSAISFDVFAHATLGSFVNGVGGTIAVPAGMEITMVAKFTEYVTDVHIPASGNVGATASFTIDTTAPVIFEMWYGSTINASALSGSGYDDGRLILTASGIGAADGSFTVNRSGGNPIVQDLDQTTGDALPANDYNGTGGNQQTVKGSGSEDIANLSGMVYDPTFFLTDALNFNFQFANMSMSLPFNSVDPSDCFTLNASGVAVGGTQAAATGADTARCGNNHVLGTYAAQAGQNGYTPNVGTVNGLLVTPTGVVFGPDFVAQTDFNSPVTGRYVPEPGSLALLGLGLAALGFNYRRRRA